MGIFDEGKGKERRGHFSAKRVFKYAYRVI